MGPLVELACELLRRTTRMAVAEGLCGRQLQQRGGISALGRDGEDPD